MFLLQDLFDRHPTLRRYWRTLLCFLAASFLVWRGYVYTPINGEDVAAPALCFIAGILFTFIAFVIFFASDIDSDDDGSWDDSPQEAFDL